MSWYYADSGKQTGPVDDATLDALIQQGAVRHDTLVWREGMANWQPLQTVRPSMAPPPPPAPPMHAPQHQQPQAHGGQAVACANCGQFFAQTDVVFIGSSYVCAACKPIFLQRMREGSAGGAAGVRRPGGFWIRFAAALIDGIIIGVAAGIVTIPLQFSLMRASDDPFANIGLTGLLSLFRMVIGAGYSGYFISTKGATPGKLLLGLQVIRSDGSPVTFARGASRYLAQIISALILLIGYIIAAFDKEKRALHDHLCDTRVIYK